MNLFLIIALVCIAALSWHWMKKPGLRGAPARTWPASRSKAGPKRKFVVPFSK